MRLWQAVYLAVHAAVPINIAAGEPVYQPLHVNQQIQGPLIPYTNGLSPSLEAIRPQIVHEPQQIIQSANPSAMMQILSNHLSSSHSPVLAHHKGRLNTDSHQSLPQPGNNDKTFQDSNNWDEPDAVLKQYGGGSNALVYAEAPMGKVRNAQRRPVLQLNSDRGMLAADSWPIIVDSLDAAAPESQESKAITSVNLAAQPKRVIRQLPLSSHRKRKCKKALSPTITSETGIDSAVSISQPNMTPAIDSIILSTPMSASPLISSYVDKTSAEANTQNIIRVTNPAIPPAGYPGTSQNSLSNIRNNPNGGANTRYRGNRIVHGVNIGGFLVPEFWITPSLIANIPDPKPVDYLQLCKRLGQEETLSLMRIHWENWVSESEVQRLAGAGLTHLRIPVGHWEFVDSGEGYVGGGLPYFKRLVYWANKYGLRVIPDMHTAPGSQNGFDNSGTAGGVNWTNDPNNVELSKRALQGMLKFLASDPVLLATVDGVDLLNEPMIDALDFQKLWEYDTVGYTLVSTLLKKTPPVVSIIDRGFKDYSWWKPRWPNEWNSKNIDAWLDAHLYHVFDHNIDNWSLEQHLNLVCQNGRDLHASSSYFPIIVGEWSLALPQNALNGRENEARRKFAEAQLDAYEQGGAGWVFWCFKTENSPEWSFLDALDRSWIPQPLSSRNFPSSC
ncbi:glycoside hydrolase [Coemansia reversa NRRL 1564]|uniref:glucan 1,3-beta-glucosidase n=1 Tax=Coemansia reversa (strain ATCC 12441 / NRRL 1564) TaxID=763665 RepID=A0A2G5BCM9_COERN|nr:glycoside hydrolase [Coemansia reversa NRRL 1564]|eukprot:PIA16766.1 glycoside hydrolase [Coemansia reversa NRRL 1564]